MGTQPHGTGANADFAFPLFLLGVFILIYYRVISLIVIAEEAFLKIMRSLTSTALDLSS